MKEKLYILRRLLFSKIGCINHQENECMFLIDGTRGGRKCCYKQCREVQKRLTGSYKEE